MTAFITALFAMPYVAIIGVILLFVVFGLVIVERLFEPIFMALAIIIIHDYFVDAPSYIGILWDNKLIVLTTIVLWLPVGTVYMYYRWRMLSNDHYDVWVEQGLPEATLAVYNQEMQRQRQPGLNANPLTFEEWFKERKDAYKCKAKDNKYSIFGWIIYWPFSGAWYVTKDFLTHIVTAIYNRMRKHLDAATDKIFDQGT